MPAPPFNPAPTRDAPGSANWPRWYNQLYKALNTLVSGWQSYTPTYTPQGSMTVSGVQVTEASYYTQGAITFVKLTLSATLGGSAGGWLNISLPLPNAGASSALTGYLSFGDNLHWQPGYCYAGASQLTIAQASYAPMTLGTCYVQVAGCYQT